MRVISLYIANGKLQLEFKKIKKKHKTNNNLSSINPLDLGQSHTRGWLADKISRKNQQHVQSKSHNITSIKYKHPPVPKPGKFLIKYYFLSFKRIYIMNSSLQIHYKSYWLAL